MNGTAIRHSVVAPRVGALDAAAYAPGIEALRAVYRQQLAELFEELQPRIEAGEFLDLGDTVCYVEPGTKLPPRATFSGAKKGRLLEVDTCGLNLLFWALVDEKKRFFEDKKAVLAILASSPFEWNDDAGSMESGDHAANCIANDLLALYRASSLSRTEN